MVASLPPVAALTASLGALSLETPLAKERKRLLERDTGPNSYKTLPDYLKEQIAHLLPLPTEELKGLVRYVVRAPSQPKQEIEKAAALFQKLIACTKVCQTLRQAAPTMPSQLIAEYALSEHPSSYNALQPFLWILKAQSLATLRERDSLTTLPASFRILGEFILHATPRELAPLMEKLLDYSREETPIGKATCDFLLHIMKVNFPLIMRGFLEELHQRKNGILPHELLDLERLLIVVTEAFFKTSDPLRSCFASCGRNFRSQLFSLFHELYGLYNEDERLKALTDLARRTDKPSAPFFHEIALNLCPLHLRPLIPTRELVDLLLLPQEDREALLSFLALPHLQVMHLAEFPSHERFKHTLIRLRIICATPIPDSANQCTREELQLKRHQLALATLQIFDRSTHREYLQNVQFVIETGFKIDVRLIDTVTHVSLLFQNASLEVMHKHIMDLMEQHDAAAQKREHYKKELDSIYHALIYIYDFLQLVIKHAVALPQPLHHHAATPAANLAHLHRSKQAVKFIELILMNFTGNPLRPEYIKNIQKLLDEATDNHTKSLLNWLLAKVRPRTN